MPTPTFVLLSVAAAIYLGVTLAGRLSGPMATMLITGTVCALLVTTAYAALRITLTERPPAGERLLIVAAVTRGAPFYSYGADRLGIVAVPLTVALVAALVGAAWTKRPPSGGNPP